MKFKQTGRFIGRGSAEYLENVQRGLCLVEKESEDVRKDKFRKRKSEQR